MEASNLGQKRPTPSRPRPRRRACTGATRSRRPTRTTGCSRSTASAAARPALATARAAPAAAATRARAGQVDGARRPRRARARGAQVLLRGAPRRRAVGRLQERADLRCTRSRRLMSKPTRKRSTTFEQASTARSVVVVVWSGALAAQVGGVSSIVFAPLRKCF